MSLKHVVRTKKGETKMIQATPIKAIRHYCLECMSFSARMVKTCEMPFAPSISIGTVKTLVV